MGSQRPSRYLGLKPPREFQRIADGDVVTMGKRDWRVITAGGHSPEHASFYCEADKILIAGDQILSHITPSVIVPSAQPDANPMKDYLDSLARFEALPAETLVLPSHGLPFRGLHLRIAQLREHHQARLQDMAELTAESLAPVSARAAAGEIDLLLVGCGPRLAMIPKDIRAAMRAQNVVMEPMDTGAAARTYNVLMAEGRRVAAALIAV